MHIVIRHVSFYDEKPVAADQNWIQSQSRKPSKVFVAGSRHGASWITSVSMASLNWGCKSSKSIMDQRQNNYARILNVPQVPPEPWIPHQFMVFIISRFPKKTYVARSWGFKSKANVRQRTSSNSWNSLTHIHANFRLQTRCWLQVCHC